MREELFDNANLHYRTSSNGTVKYTEISAVIAIAVSNNKGAFINARSKFLMIDALKKAQKK
jgi:hypothetical protein